MELYHAEIGLPANFVTPTERVGLCWTRHADSERTKDRYANEIPRFKTLPLSMFKVVEVGMEGNHVAKIVVRGHWTTDLDLIFVLIPDYSIFAGPWTVKTVWINKRNDLHKTLDRSRYVG